MTPNLRPRDFALLLLASDDLRPRQRARDQAPDLAGLALERRILNELAGRDPEPGELEASLMEIVEEIGPPTGPTRAIAVHVRDDYLAAAESPDLISHLLDQATREGRKGDGRGR
ncbi:MAG: hypothetical protein ACJ8F7_05515 [Gemmataceae bacterium]